MRQLGLILGHEAAERAANHAEREMPTWKDTAYSAFVSYGKIARQFTTEDVRLASPEVPPPPDNRAWGQVAMRARRAGVVVSQGWVPVKDANSHGCVKTLWKWVGP